MNYWLKRVWIQCNILQFDIITSHCIALNCHSLKIILQKNNINLVVNNANKLTLLTYLTECPLRWIHHFSHSFSHSYKTTSYISKTIKPTITLAKHTTGQNNMPCRQSKQCKGKQAKQQVLMQNQSCPVDVILVNGGSSLNSCGNICSDACMTALRSNVKTKATWRGQAPTGSGKTRASTHSREENWRQHRVSRNQISDGCCSKQSASKQIRGLSTGGATPALIQ